MPNHPLNPFGTRCPKCNKAEEDVTWKESKSGRQDYLLCQCSCGFTWRTETYEALQAFHQSLCPYRRCR
jgi:hypothetical protein